MKHTVAIFTLSLTIHSFSMEFPDNQIPGSHKRKLTATQALALKSEPAKLRAPTPHVSLTSNLDYFKCCFILGILSPQSIEKLKQKLEKLEMPHEIGALLAQRQHMGQTLSLSQQLEVWRWEAYIAKKYLKSS